jgi:hypothetical protein
MLDTWIPQNTISISNHKEQEIGAGEHAVKTCDSKVHFITRKQVTGDTSNHHLNKIITHQEKFHDSTISTMTRERGWKLKEYTVVRSVSNAVKQTTKRECDNKSRERKNDGRNWCTLLIRRYMGERTLEHHLCCCTQLGHHSWCCDSTVQWQKWLCTCHLTS